MTINKYVKIFKALGEPTRLKILKLLSVRPMYVCELESVLNMSQPRISQHLRTMKEAGLVTEKKEAQRTFYSLQIDYLDECFDSLIAFFHADLAGLPQFKEEYLRLKQVDNDREISLCKEGKIEAVPWKQEA
ncbi:winged helix-turn-helix transcriptional regulator [Desulfallas sp. Bu1-1]|jgi:ArsR family transcriptional regulator|uniref:ArsR/SmtB family transcription factor n=1 Tax=Desulfallas sp. Bu1-1 TaxID=2787620 RepID=UPI0018A0D77C|nr:metalloregulator ArsR/SmtB family transcription factor [Desulfallas sp. Bu1-1]MBF7084598.1 winged helix-turn-helix transcriptional regulator [Desulfallas sp. Bu1-1]